MFYFAVECHVSTFSIHGRVEVRTKPSITRLKWRNTLIIICWSSVCFTRSYLMLHQQSTPDRDHGLHILKYLMLLFRADSSRSKYSWEYWYVLLSDRDANRGFYYLFVKPMAQRMSILRQMIVWKLEKHLKSTWNTWHLIRQHATSTTRQVLFGEFKRSANLLMQQQTSSDKGSIHMETVKRMRNPYWDLRSLWPFHYTPNRTLPDVCVDTWVPVGVRRSHYAE